MIVIWCYSNKYLKLFTKLFISAVKLILKIVMSLSFKYASRLLSVISD